MDIDLLSKMVKEIILDNDRVVLPGLGSFVAELVPSTFSDKGYTINPPYRRLYFRAKPDEGSEIADFYSSPKIVKSSKRIVTYFDSLLENEPECALVVLNRLKKEQVFLLFFLLPFVIIFFLMLSH